MSRIVKNPLDENHVIISTYRKKRPFQQKELRCPFCVGSDEVTESFNKAISLPNKYPSLSMDYEHAKGICEVILYSDNHTKTLTDHSSEFIESVIRHWISRIKEIEKNTDLEYIFIFENYGKKIGVSLEHPHGQIYSFPFIPKTILEKYRSFEDTCVYCDETILIHENSTFNISTVEFAKWPFELHIYPKNHIHSLAQLNEREIKDLALCLQLAFQSLYYKFGKNTPYILGIYQTYIKDHSDIFHLHIELISPMITKDRFKFRAGIETSLDIFINSVDPLEFSEEMRNIIKRFEK